MAVNFSHQHSSRNTTSQSNYHHCGGPVAKHRVMSQDARYNDSHDSINIITLTLQVARFLLEEARAKINLETTLSVAAGYGDPEIVR